MFFESKDIVFMGDSITKFWKEKSDFFSNNRNYSNKGISGQTTSQMLPRFQKDVINLKPDKVVILAGINDLAENTGFISLDKIL
jgi:lysophospholipase L1-like esterase